MANLSFITDRLATGGDLPDDDGEAVRHLDEWERLGITHVVDNRAEYSDESFVAHHAPQITYLHHGTDDAGQRMPDAWFDDGVSFVRSALAQPTSAVLVHCHMGINRGPSLAYAVLLDAGWDPVAAIDTIRAARPIAAVGYAEDALDWHLRRSGATPSEHSEAQRRLRAWRQTHPLDVVRIIRRIRHNQAS